MTIKNGQNQAASPSSSSGNNSIREAAKTHKKQLEETKKQVFESKFMTYKKLLNEGVKPIKDISESMLRLSDIADTIGGKFPQTAKFIAESFLSLTNAVYRENPLMFQESMIRLSAVSEFLKKLPEIHESGNRLAGFKQTKAGSLLEEKDYVAVVKESENISLKQAKLFSENVKVIPVILSDRMIQEAIQESTKLTNQALLMEAVDLDTLARSMDSLTTVVAKLGPEFKETKAGLEKFKSRFRNAASGNFQGLTTDNQNRLLAQVDLVLNMFSKLGKLWPQIKKLFGDALEKSSGLIGAKSDPEFKKTLEQLKTVIKKQLGGNFIDGLARLFGKGNVIFPSEINPDIVIQDMLEVLEAPGGEAAAQAPAGIQQETYSRIMKHMILEDLAKLDQAMSALASNAPPPPAPEQQKQMVQTVNQQATGGTASGETPASSSAGNTGSAPEAKPQQFGNELVVSVLSKLKDANFLNPAQKAELVKNSLGKFFSGEGNVMNAFQGIDSELMKKEKEMGAPAVAPVAGGIKKPTNKKPQAQQVIKGKPVRK